LCATSWNTHSIEIKSSHDREIDLFRVATKPSFEWALAIASAVTIACGSTAEEPGYSAAGSAGTTSVGGTASSGGSPSGGGGYSGYGANPSGGSAGSGSQTAIGGAAGAGATGGVSCVPLPACDAPLPDLGPKRSWKHSTSGFISDSGFANHRGRDLILEPDADQWVLGKFAYGVVDKDIHDEEVDIWLNRDCSSSWEKLGTGLTTEDDSHAAVEGVDDTGGRIYFQIPPSQKLGVGRHRIYMSVAGDLSSTVQYIEVMPQGTVYFVTDVDGTLTTKETEEYGALLTASVSEANPDAAEALSLLAEKGYRPFYLTARPEFLVGRTREFIETRGFPLGVVHTTLAYGATGSAAGTFKLGELKELEQRGFKVSHAFGNTSSDADAFFTANIEPANQRIFFQYTDSAHGGRRIDAYQQLLGEFGTSSPPCQ
jgi:hypothetical protein